MTPRAHSRRSRALPLVRKTAENDGEMSLESVRRAFVRDFHDSWNAVARDPDATGRGNFMYAFMATNYLEWATTVAHQDPRVAKRFARELRNTDRRYFKKLPTNWAVKPPRWFPTSPAGSQQHLLWALFDLVRNGIAHRYQQIDAVLDDDARFRVQVTGAQVPVSPSGQAQRSEDHLSILRVEDVEPAYLVIRLHPEVLFADIDSAVQASGLLALEPPRFRRRFATSIAKLRKVLA